MAEQSAGERTEQATPRRRQDARKKGTVARSADLGGALGLLAVALVSPAVFTTLSGRLLGGLAASLAQAPAEVSLGTVSRYSFAVLGPGLAAVAPLILSVMVVGLVASFAQVGFVVSAEALNPQLNRLNPFPGFQRLFSIRASFDGLKAVGKMLLFAGVAYGAVRSDWESLVATSLLTPAQAAVVVGSLVHTVLLRVSLVWLVIAVADYMFQRRQVEKQLMMTKDELRREMREQEGSPEVKGAQMRKRRQLAKGSLAGKLRTADVVVTNPTHFAVAVTYDRSKMPAPMVVAKGADYLAQRIKALAGDLDVPIVENKALARALYKQCEVGDFVPRDLFAPVAEVLAYVYQTLKRVKPRLAHVRDSRRGSSMKGG